jgi:mannose-1-phosphate guanylyltransferase
MRKRINIWAIVLAGGDGSRLKELTTTPAGQVIPKQFCSFQGQSCLLEDAIGRAEKVAMPQCICCVVAAKHRQWWPESLNALPQQNVLVQPRNRGTGHGILFALLQLEMLAPDSVVVMLPADHYVVNEATMARSLRTATTLAANNKHLIYVLGAEPDRPDQELGYIVPTASRHATAAGVLRFVEKPSIDIARSLISEGALWNTFIFAGSVRALLSIFEGRYTSTIRGMREAIALIKVPPVGSVGLELLYQELETLDFAKHVLERQEQRLQVLRVPSCGWTDLGTPTRVAETVRKLSSATSSGREGRSGAPPFLDLAAQRPREHAPATG